jgi:hypothetical protein
MTNVVTSARVSPWNTTELAALDLADVPWWTEVLGEAERSVRQLRHQLELLGAGEQRTCHGCSRPMTGRANRRYCTDACRQRAYRSRQT